jgi:hypothetical protein
MIFFSRTASIAPGKASDAIAFGHLIAKYIKETYGTTLEVLVPIGGDPNRIAWHARYDSIAEWDAVTSKLLTDKLYVEHIPAWIRARRLVAEPLDRRGAHLRSA